MKKHKHSKNCGCETNSFSENDLLKLCAIIMATGGRKEKECKKNEDSLYDEMIKDSELAK